MEDISLFGEDMYMSTHIYTHRYTDIHMCVYIHISIFMETNMYIYIYIYIYTHIYKHTNINIYTFMAHPSTHLLNIYSHRIAVKNHVNLSFSISFYILLVLYMANVIFLLKCIFYGEVHDYT